jgi:glycosyltransferase involved in cell wall biosynthesis
VNGWNPRPREHALYAGRLSPEKGVGVLLDAAELVDLPLKIAGDGPMREQVQAAAASGRVEYLGQLCEADLAKVRQQAAFVVVPSIGPDISPFSALEALADGTPVIASNVGGLPEIVDDPNLGAIVPPGDPQALASAMMRLWARRGAADFGRAAWERAREQYSLDQQTRRIIDLYAGLARST